MAVTNRFHILFVVLKTPCLIIVLFRMRLEHRTKTYWSLDKAVWPTTSSVMPGVFYDTSSAAKISNLHAVGTKMSKECSVNIQTTMSQKGSSNTIKNKTLQ